jgi:hypothetical protein
MALTQITGKVTRVMPETNNFFILPDNPRALSSTDIDGHRCGLGEVSANLLNARASKLARYPLPLPAVGDIVTLDVLPGPAAAATGPLTEVFGEGNDGTD